MEKSSSEIKKETQQEQILALKDIETIEKAKKENKKIILAIDVVTAREYGLYEGSADNEFETIDVVVAPEKAEECLKKGKCRIHYEEGEGLR